MKNLMLLLVCTLGLSACSWFKSSAVQAVLKPVASAACADETKALTALAASVASTLQCSAPAQIVTDLTTALGNANVCKYSASNSSAVIKPAGLVGNIVCPVAASTVVGFLTGVIPAAWGCTATQSADAVQAALISVCEAAVPVQQGVTK